MWMSDSLRSMDLWSIAEIRPADCCHGSERYHLGEGGLMKKNSQHWAASKPEPCIQLSAKVKAIVLARVAELRKEKVEGAELSGGQADE